MDHFLFEDWDEPFHIPLDILRTDPKRYAELLIQRRDKMDQMIGIFAPVLKQDNEKIGKVFISSTMSDDPGYAQSLWNEANDADKPETGLVRFFKPFQ